MSGVGKIASLLTVPGLINELAPKPETPDFSQLTTSAPVPEAPPQVAQAPEVQKIEEVPVKDIEGAQVRARKRRAAAAQSNQLVSLGSGQTSSTITKSILGS